ncbi:putative RNA-binding protein CG14230 isoform X2 [Andrena cerasifolii]|uniref:putative RNA-binding protein CG14230 isoform X2 n=1 Tax=Andrena cerasifolii TaxID=2819439 RepID=UPI00403800A7
MQEISESEKKRLESLKRQKEAFRAKELAVRNALKNLDSKTNANKIIFNDDVYKAEQPKVKKKTEKRKHDLFDDDDDNYNDDNGESLLDVNKFGMKKNAAGRTLGNDDRFKIDERFVENDHISEESVTVENNDASDLHKEKEWQLDILENILGVPITSKTKEVNKDSKFAKKEMIRYDPTVSNHKEYEIVPEKSEANVKKVKTKKKAKDIVEDVENEQVEVSKDVYFSVSESLSKSLKEGGQFSLLKTYGKEENIEKDNDDNATAMESAKQKKFEFNFSGENSFKCDSLDDEIDNDKGTSTTKNEQTTSNVIKETNNFFFDSNDTRFNEAVTFFSKESVPDDEFKNLRRELKQIVRSKIRRNVRNSEPWGRKKKIKRFS